MNDTKTTKIVGLTFYQAAAQGCESNGQDESGATSTE